MPRNKMPRKTLFTIFLIDVALLFIFVMAFMRAPAYRMILVPLYLPTAVIVDVVFMRRKLKRVDPHQPEALAGGPRGTALLYVGAVVFFLGAIYGIALISSGELPLLSMLGFLVPCSLAVYYFNVARQRKSARSKRPDPRPTRIE